MVRIGLTIVGLIVLSLVGGCVWLIGGSGAFASVSNAPSVLIDKPIEQASYKLLDVAVPDDIKRLDDEIERSTGQGVIRTERDGREVTWTFELDNIDFVTVVAKVEAASDTKSELDVSVRLEDSPLTEAENGLTASDRLLTENALDATLTEHIAAKLEGRPTDKQLLRNIGYRLELANALQREAFKARVEVAIDHAIKPRLEKYAAQAKRRYSDNYDSGSPQYDSYRARREQREASAPTSSAEPMVRLPSN